MRFRIQTDIFRKALDATSRAASTSKLTPILENILIDAGYDQVTLTGNNLEMSIEYTIKENVTVESEGRFTVESKFLLQYISLVHDSELEVEQENSGTITFITKSGRTKIHGMEASKFPSTPMIHKNDPIVLGAEDLKWAIDKTLFSAAENSVRPMLSGIYFNAGWDKLTFASTDSFRLSDYVIKTREAVSHPPIIIPKKTASELAHLINSEEVKQVEIYVQDTQMFAQIWNVTMTSRLLAGKFPEYGAFFPTEFQTKSTVLRSDLINALKQANLVAKDNNNNVRVRSLTEGKVEIFTGDTEKGASNRSVSGTTEWKDDTIGINSEYLLNVLSVIREDYVSFEYKNPLSPIVVRGVATDNSLEKEYRHLIMPLKI